MINGQGILCENVFAGVDAFTMFEGTVKNLVSELSIG